MCGLAYPSQSALPGRGTRACPIDLRRRGSARRRDRLEDLVVVTMWSTGTRSRGLVIGC
jgi:hypothetical protein